MNISLITTTEDLFTNLKIKNIHKFVSVCDEYISSSVKTVSYFSLHIDTGPNMKSALVGQFSFPSNKVLLVVRIILDNTDANFGIPNNILCIYIRANLIPSRIQYFQGFSIIGLCQRKQVPAEKILAVLTMYPIKHLLLIYFMKILIQSSTDEWIILSISYLISPSSHICIPLLRATRSYFGKISGTHLLKEVILVYSLSDMIWLVV